MTARKLLHVFSTFDVGGPQVRFVQLANQFKERYKHLIITMDGNTQAMEHIGKGVDATLIPVPVSKGRTLRNVRTFGNLLSVLQPDLLVTSNWGSIEWALANKFYRFPHVHMEDGFGSGEAEKQLKRRIWIRRLALKKTCVVVPSHSLLEIAYNVWKLPRTHVLYIPNGVECSRFLSAPDLELSSAIGIRPDLPVIGTISGLRPEKNLFRLLRAFTQLQDSIPSQLVIVGTGPQMVELRRLSESLGINQSVIFTGALASPERLLSLFSIFALSSDTEQMPLTILEAMASARVIASTDVGDVKTMVSPENRPFIVPRGSRPLAEALRALLENRERATQIGSLNRERVVALYDQKRMFDSYKELFDGKFMTTTIDR